MVHGGWRLICGGIGKSASRTLARIHVTTLDTMTATIMARSVLSTPISTWITTMLGR